MFQRLFDEIFRAGCDAYVGTGGAYNYPRSVATAAPAGVVQPARIAAGLNMGLRVDDLLSLCSTFSTGGPFEALCQRIDGSSPYVVMFASGSSLLEGGQRMQLSPQRNSGREWTNCTLRRNGRTVTSAGAISFWKSATGFALLYMEGDVVLELVERNWAISARERNRLQHALNGNARRDRRFDGLPVPDGGVFADIAAMGFDLAWGSFACSMCRSRFAITREEAEQGGYSPFYRRGTCDACPLYFWMCNGNSVSFVPGYAQPVPPPPPSRLSLPPPPPLSSSSHSSQPAPSQPRSAVLSSSQSSASLGDYAGFAPYGSSGHLESAPNSSASALQVPAFRPTTQTTRVSLVSSASDSISSLSSDFTQGFSNIVGIWASGGDPDDPGPKVHFGGLVNPKGGDRVITCQFEEFADDLESYGQGYYYTRCGEMFGRVEGAGCVADAGDWLHTRSRINSKLGLRAILVKKTTHQPPCYVFDLVWSTAKECTTPPRCEEFTHKGVRFVRFKGRQQSLLSIDERRVLVSSQTLGEVLRYFTNSEKTRVCASHIMGHLKNSETEAEEIHAIMRFAAAWHDRNLLSYALNVSGDKWIEQEAELRMSGAMPTVWESFMEWTGHGWRGWGIRIGLCALACWFSVFALWWLGIGFELLFPGSVFYQGFHVVRLINASCVDSFAHINGTFLSLRAATLLSMPTWDNSSTEFALSRGFVPGDVYRLSTTCGNTTAVSHNLSWWEARHRLEASPECGGTVVGILIRYFVNACLVCFVSPVMEEYIKSQLGWAGVFLIIAFEAHSHYAVSLKRLVQYLLTAWLHILYYLCGFGWGTKLHMMYNSYVMKLPIFHMRVALLLAVSRSFDLCSLAEILRFAVKDIPHWDYVPEPLVLVQVVLKEVWGFDFHTILGLLSDGFVAYTHASPHAALLVLMAMEFCRNRNSCFQYIEAMGAFSRYVEHFRLGGVEIKQGSFVRLNGHRKARGKNRLIRLMPMFVPVASFAGNQANALHSCAGRVLKPTPILTDDLAALERVLSLMTDRMEGPITPRPRDWADSFPLGKRERYHLALDRLEVFGFAWFTRVSRRYTRWNRRSCFIKHEANLAHSDVRTPGGYIACADPRTIQASTDEVQAVSGPWFVELGKRASEVFDGSEGSMVDGWHILVGFGLTKAEIAARCVAMVNSRGRMIVDCGDDALVIVDGKIYALDAKRWDAHVGPELLRLKTPHLLRLGVPRETLNMMERLIRRRGSYKGLGVAFGVDGDVASGDPDTLYWNTILGVALLIASFDSTESFEVQATRWGIEYEVAAVASRSCYAAALDFCSCIFVPVRGGGYTFAPKLGRSLMKLGVSATMGNPVKLLSAKLRGAMCDLAAYPEVVAHLARLSSKLPTVEAVSESYFPVGKCEPGTYAERVALFAERYGVDYADVVAEVKQLVDKTIACDFDGSGLVILRRLVEVDYGKRIC